MCLQDRLYEQGFKAYPEVEDYIAANRTDFIGISLDKVTFVHKFAARKLGINPEDVLLSLIIFVQMGWFQKVGMFGSKQLYSPIAEMWETNLAQK